MSEKVWVRPEPETTQLIERFSSLGDNCEFGFVQRHFGAEPLDLLRWAGNIRLPAFIEALTRRFDGLAERDFTHWLSGERGEYVLTETVYGLTYHTFQYSDEVGFEELTRKERPRLQFLKRKFLEDLEDGTKIWVFRNGYGEGDDEATMRRLFDVLQGYGANQLLWVAVADADNPPLSVRTLDARFCKGHLTGLADQFKPWEARHDEWLQVCRRALKVLRPIA